MGVGGRGEEGGGAIPFKSTFQHIYNKQLCKCDPQGPAWALSGGVERGTIERPGIWSCDLWANERPGNKFHWVGTDTHTHTDKWTGQLSDCIGLGADSVKIRD